MCARATGDLVRTAAARAARETCACNHTGRRHRVDHAGARSCAGRPDGLLSVLGVRRGQVRSRFLRLLEFHAVVSLRRAALRRDGHQIGDRPSPRVSGHAERRAQLHAPASRSDPLRFHSDVPRSVRNRARRADGRGGPRTHRSVWRRAGEQHRTRDVHHPHLHRDGFRQDDHRRCGVHYSARDH